MAGQFSLEGFNVNHPNSTGCGGKLVLRIMGRLFLR